MEYFKMVALRAYNRMAISSITLSELIYGAKKSQNVDNN
jgi:predicted nucleic acid-binding protein